MSLLPILGAISGIGSLFGGISGANAASAAAGQLGEQTGLMKRAQKYQFARQAQIDPIFLGLLSQALTRTHGVPRMAGAYGPGVNPLMSALRGYRVQLPKPELIGGEDPYAALAGGVR